MLKLTFLLLCALAVAVAGHVPVSAARPEERRREADRPQKVDRPDPGAATDPAVKAATSQDKSATFADDVSETEKFVRENSPNRYKGMKQGKLKPGPVMVSRFREMRNLQAEDKVLYDIRVEQMKQEDEIFPVISRVRENPSDPAARAQLHELVGKLVDLRKREHDYRIKKLEDLLKAEVTKRDKLVNREEAIRKREEDELKHNGNLFGPGAGNLRREQFELAPDAGK